MSAKQLASTVSSNIRHIHHCQAKRRQESAVVSTASATRTAPRPPSLTSSQYCHPNVEKCFGCQGQLTSRNGTHTPPTGRSGCRWHDAPPICSGRYNQTENERCMFFMRMKDVSSAGYPIFPTLLLISSQDFPH